MSEFTHTGLNTVSSLDGFTVEARFAEVMYHDVIGSVEIYAEWGGTPTEVFLYKRSLKGVASARIEEVLSNVTRALSYLGHRVQILEE
jgi:hypothetical protein